MANLFNDASYINFNLEFGFAWLSTSVSSNDNLFQVCLNERKDGKGFKKEISKNDCGFDWGICGDYNEGLYGDFSENSDKYLKEFLSIARKSGFKIVQ